MDVTNADFDPFSPQFTLSTGGPATTVTWMRDSEIVSDGTSTVLEDTETAEYTHTLTVTGRLGGYYQCIDKPSMASSSLVIQGKPFCYIHYSLKVSAKCSNCHSV